MRKLLLPSALAVGACVACCAPLILPPLAAVLAAGGVSLAVLSQSALAIALVAAAGWWWWRSSRARRVTAPEMLRQVGAVPDTLPRTSGCGCGPATGCNAGDACELPVASAKQ